MAKNKKAQLVSRIEKKTFSQIKSVTTQAKVETGATREFTINEILELGLVAYKHRNETDH